MTFPILVLGHNRPDYLYIALSGLYRANGIAEHPVYVFLDGGGKCDEEHKDVFRSFPIAGYMVRDTNLDTLEHFTFSIQALLDFGYDEVFYITDDILVTTDILGYLASAPRDSFFITTRRFHKPGRYKDYSGFGNLVNARQFPELYTFVVRKEYLGKPSYKGRIMRERPGEDAPFNYFVSVTDHYSRGDDKPYTFHFGVLGRNSGKTDPVLQEAHDKLTEGPPDKWVDNAIAMLNEEHEHPLLRTRIRPHGRDYR